MQLTQIEEVPMRTATLFAPVIAAEKRLVSLPGRRFEVDRKELSRSIEISEDEILDDLLYPADRRAVRSAASENGRLKPR
jgi:hypothetical protein